MTIFKTPDHLPPMMGFPHEGHVVSSDDANGLLCDFYTCVIEPFRVFVWGSQDMWFVQTAITDATSAEQQFYNASGKQHRIPRDPITLMAIIQHLTSETPMEGIYENSMPSTGTDDDVLPPYLETGCLIALPEWGRARSKMGTRFTMLGASDKSENIDSNNAGVAGG